MSPESLETRIYSFASDVWSFGILVWEVWMGRKPHDEYNNIVEIALKIRDFGYHPEIPEDAPTWLKELLGRCWQMAPQDRPSMKDIVSLFQKEVISNSMQDSLHFF